jgi:hypothetical protein
MKNWDGANKLLDSLNDVDDKYVEEALEFYDRNKSKKNIIDLSFFLKYATIAACLVLVVGASFTFKLQQKNDVESVAAVNPYQEVNSLQEASKITGFDMKVPESIGEYNNQLISVIGGKIIEVRYLSSDEKDTGIIIRKSRGDEDISGDYNTYSTNITENIYGKDVNLRGDGERIFVATWTEDGFSYAVMANDYIMDKEQIEYLIGVVK